MIRVLFVCIHNSARSQMAEAFLDHLGDGKYEAESAGIEAGTLNPHVVQVMLEAGLDISSNTTNDVFDFLRQGKTYQAVITVCDAANAERCPVFPGATKRFAWSFPDPSQFTGTLADILEQTRIVRDQVKEKVAAFITATSDLKYWIA